MRAHSNALRWRAIKAVEAGEAVKSIAQRLEVSDKWVYKLAKQYRETKHYEVRKSPGRPRKLNDKDLKTLADLVKQFPDATLRELKEKGELDISISSLDRYLLRMKITFKKTSLCHRAKAGGGSQSQGRLDSIKPWVRPGEINCYR